MPSLLHVQNGDATRAKLERSGVHGEITVWADVLHDGPVPGGVSDDEFRRVRARYLTPYDDLALSEDAAVRRLGRRMHGWSGIRSTARSCSGSSTICSTS